MTRFVLLCFLLFVCFELAACYPPSDDDTFYTAVEDFSDDDDDTVQENPAFVDKHNETDDSREDASVGSVKAALSKALAETKSLTPGKVLRFAQKHRLQITIALAVVAFRRELGQVLWRVITKPVLDPETGKVVRRRIPIQPTAILKIILFVELIRRFQAAQSKSGKSDDMSETPSGLSPLVLFLLMGGRASPGMILFLSRLLSPTNSAYVPPVKQHYTFERLNERYKKDEMALQKAVDPTGRSKISTPKNATRLSDLILGTHRPASPPQPLYNETIIVMDLTDLDTSISKMDILRDEVTFLLNMHKIRQGNETPEPQLDEVIVLLESPGGSAADYSLASQQILRLRNEGIKVTICVDKVAASGGYMIACTSSPGCLYAAPFAVLGSIGVIGQTFNIHKTLEGWGIRPLVFRGGKDKAPVGLIGEVTEEGIAKVQDMIDKTHCAFKRHVAECRPAVASEIDELATGEVWLGNDALDLGLVDRILTSDEYIGERISGGARVLKLVQLIRPKYPFQQPTTTSALTNPEMMNGNVLRSLLSEFRVYLEKAVEALGSFASQGDLRTASRSFEVADVRTPK